MAVGRREIARLSGKETDSGAPGKAPAGMTALRPQTGTSRLGFDARRWTWLDAIAGAAAVTLLFSLFDPWYDIRFAGCPGGACRADNRLGKLSGIATHGYLWATFAAALAILVLLVLRALDRAGFFQSPSDRQLLAGLTGLNVSLVLLAFLDRPGFIHLPSQGPPPALPLPLLTVSWRYGAWMAVTATTVAVIAAVLNLTRARPSQ